MRTFSQSFYPAHLAINYGLQSKCLHLKLLHLAQNPVWKMLIEFKNHTNIWQNIFENGKFFFFFNVSFDVYSCIPSSGPYIKGARREQISWQIAMHFKINEFLCISLCGSGNLRPTDWNWGLNNLPFEYQRQVLQKITIAAKLQTMWGTIKFPRHLRLKRETGKNIN